VGKETKQIKSKQIKTNQNPKRYSFMQCEMGAKKHYGVGRYFKGSFS
jgi:hypothetical protein